MPYEILTEEPTELVAGDTWEWRKSLPEFPPSAGWQLNYRLAGESDVAIAWGSQVSAVGEEFVITVAAADTNKPAGGYVLTGYVVKAGGLRYTLRDADGQPVRIPVTVVANPATAVNSKSQDERELAALELVILDLRANPQQAFTINGRSVTYMDLAELERQRGVLRQRIQSARDPNAAFRTVEVGFVAPR